MAWLYQANLTAKGIQMGNEEWCHKLSIGTDWTKIRIGVRIACACFQNFDGNPIGPTLVLGMCQGTTNVFKSVTCTEFMGMGLGVNSGSERSFTYALAPGPNVNNTRPIFITKVNGAFQNHLTGSASFYISAINTVRTVAFIDILKNSSTSYTLSGFMPGNTTQATTDNTYGVFMASMESNATPTNANSTGAPTITYTGPGLFDSIYFSWGKSTPPITLFDFCACRVL